MYESSKPRFEPGTEMEVFMRETSDAERKLGIRQSIRTVDVDWWISTPSDEDQPSLLEKGPVHVTSMEGNLSAMYEEKRSYPDGKDWYPHVFRDNYSLRRFFKHTHVELVNKLPTNIVHYPKGKKMEKDDIVEVFRIVAFPPEGRTDMVCWRTRITAYGFYKRAVEVLNAKMPIAGDYVKDCKRLRITQKDWDDRPTAIDFPKEAPAAA